MCVYCGFLWNENPGFNIKESEICCITTKITRHSEKLCSHNLIGREIPVWSSWNRMLLHSFRIVNSCVSKRCMFVGIGTIWLVRFRWFDALSTFQCVPYLIAPPIFRSFVELCFDLSGVAHLHRGSSRVFCHSCICTMWSYAQNWLWICFNLFYLWERISLNRLKLTMLLFVLKLIYFCSK